MSALANYLFCCGHNVSGSDLVSNAQTKRLQSLGVKVVTGNNKDNLDTSADYLVYTQAIDPADPELIYAKELGIKIISREKLLGRIFRTFTNRIAVSGAHGKTTTCGLLYQALSANLVSPTAFIGGEISGLGNFIMGKPDYCIAEACEYKGSFLTLSSTISVILNVDLEHLDYYKELKDIERAFNKFACKTCQGGVVVTNGDAVPYYITNNCLAKNITYGFNKNNNFFATNITQKNAKYSFDCYKNGDFYAHINLLLRGRHNIYNALATLCVCDSLGLDKVCTVKGIESFLGAQRRWQIITNSFTNIVEDYAHHPSEVRSLVETALQLGYDKIILAFQPHTYTRTSKLFLDFVSCFVGVDYLIMLPIYPAREQPIVGVTSKHLADTIADTGLTNAIYCQDFESAGRLIATLASKEDLVLVVGAGDIFKLSSLLQAF